MSRFECCVLQVQVSSVHQRNSSATSARKLRLQQRPVAVEPLCRQEESGRRDLKGSVGDESHLVRLPPPLARETTYYSLNLIVVL